MRKKDSFILFVQKKGRIEKGSDATIYSTKIFKSEEYTLMLGD